jgi:RHS repeat-associated protein
VTLAPGADATQATEMSYDALGRTTEVTNPDGTWVRNEYDKAGNVVKVTSSADASPSVKTAEYDLAGRVTKTIDAVGAQTTSAYDLQGRVVGSGIVGQGGSQVVYNTLGQVISQTDVDGITTKTHYDAAGRVEQIEVAGKATLTEYDSAGRVSKVTDPDGLSIERDYDAFSKVTTETHRRGADILKQTTAAYDVLGRVSGTSQTAGGVRSDISYNGVSGKPRLASIRYAESTSSIQFSPAEGAETTRTFTMAGVSTTRVVMRDAQGRVAAVTVPGLGTRGTGYDASGKITSQTGFGLTGSGATYGYGESGQKTSESLSLSYPGASFENSYGYTAAGRLATASIDGTMTGYHYDDAGNLDLVTKGGVDTTLTYDQASRRLMAMGTTEFGWDETQGRRTSMRRSGESSVTYEYTDAGRLARFADPNTSTTASYTYGVGGQRDSSAVTVGSLTTTTTYVYDGLSLLNLAAQRSDGETYSITYSYGEDQRAWAAVYASSDTTAPTLFHLVTTDRGDVVELTDAVGQPFSAYRYDAWGRVLSASSQATGSISASTAADITARQPLRYAGYCYDAESSTYYLSARQYDPATMQFMTKDPARADGEESAYQYCGGDPVGKVDLSGLHARKAGLRRTHSHFLPGLYLAWWRSDHWYVRKRLAQNSCHSDTGTHLWLVEQFTLNFGANGYWRRAGGAAIGVAIGPELAGLKAAAYAWGAAEVSNFVSTKIWKTDSQDYLYLAGGMTTYTRAD